MTRLSNKWVLTAATLIALFAFHAPASAVVVTVDVAQIPGVTESAVGITGFQTTGLDMEGILVTAIFNSAGEIVEITESWSAGQASGSDQDSSGRDLAFQLSQSGDTFTGAWVLSNLSAFSEAALTGILIDGFPGDTVFDRVLPNDDFPVPPNEIGTPGSDIGKDFFSDTDIPLVQLNILATYMGVVAIGASNPVGDIFRYLDINLGGGIFSTDPSLVFLADTDSVGLPPGQVPEPGSTLLLLGAGLIALYRRRRG